VINPPPAHLRNARRPGARSSITRIAAARAHSRLSALSFDDRTQAIKRMADAQRECRLARCALTREQGKPVQQSKDEINRAATLPRAC
jgi:acyl-CoA reductase-like NAD-dependent aldehyde dehydrogenase